MTTTSTTQAAPERAATVRDLRTFERRAAAAILLVPGTAVALSRLFTPEDEDTLAALNQIAADPSAQTIFSTLGFLSALTAVPAFLAMARLARRRRPVLTTIALATNLAAFLGGFVMFSLDHMYLQGALLPTDQRAGAAALIDRMWSSGLPGVSTTLFVLGHFVGVILMALALRGSIPTVGWVAMIGSVPGHILAFVIFPSRVSDALSWGLFAVALALCAVAVLRTPDDEWDLPPARRPVRTRTQR